MPPEALRSDLWSHVLAAIREHVTPQQFETWFRGVQPGPCSEKLLDLTVPNSFTKEWLRTRYLEVIQCAAEKLLAGHRPRVRIKVRPAAEGGHEMGAAAADLALSSLRTVARGGSIPAAAAPVPAARGAETKGVSAPRPFLNPDFRFDSFVCGPANHLPVAAFMAVMDQRGGRYNPLFLHGGVGSGKTHLLQALVQGVKERHPRVKVRYVPCEHFLNHFILAVERHKLTEFRQTYRDLDLLVVDDVHLLAQKERTQEEFLHTFNAIFLAGGQIVLAADGEPGAIPFLTDRLSSRFRGGLVCALSGVELTTRKEIVRQHGALLQADLKEEVVDFVAGHVTSNVRELKGAVTRLVGHAELSQLKPSLDLAESVLQDVILCGRKGLSLEQIVGVVTRRYGVSLADLQGRRRIRAIAGPRQICMFLARRLTSLSFGGIGAFFGGRDHSTVHYACQHIQEREDSDPSFHSHLEELAAEVARERGA